MKLTQADWLRIAGVVIGIGGAVNSQVLEAMGFSAGIASHVAAVVGFVVLAVSIVSAKLANPSPPAGTNFAAIPHGMVPAAGIPNSNNPPGPGVAVVDAATTTIQPLSQKVN